MSPQRAASLAALAPTAAHAAPTIDEMHVRIRVMPDAVLHVEESIEFLTAAMHPRVVRTLALRTPGKAGAPLLRIHEVKATGGDGHVVAAELANAAWYAPASPTASSLGDEMNRLRSVARRR